jgi:hypothetical protein
MRKSNQKLKVSAIVMFTITLLNFAITLYSQGQQKQVQGIAEGAEQVKAAKSTFPTADYDTPEPVDPDKRAKRKARNARHDKSTQGVKGGLNAPSNSGDEIVLVTDWETSVPRIPATQSDVILIGEILDANAYVSTDKNGVYSEFKTRVEDVLKNDNVSPISRGVEVSLERHGGQVRYPSGRTDWFHIALQSMPLVNRRYIVFLKRIGDESFHLITGYELRGGHVYSLDSDASQFRFYDGMDESRFLQQLREVLGKTS